MKFHKISVVMPVYNGEKYLSEAIESILCQTLSDFEFIIIDDGSTDKTLDIIQSYMRHDGRIVLISRENRGLIASLNEGLDSAKGKYIARMDADDISCKARFEKQYLFLEENPDVGVCGSWAEVFGENIKTKVWKMPFADKELRPRLIFSVPFAHPSVMMRREIIDETGLRYHPKYKNAEDYKFWLDLSKYTQFSNIQEVLIKYRYHNQSISRLADNKNSADRFEVISQIQREAICLIGLRPSKEELRLHFLVALNERISKNAFDSDQLNAYFYKLMDGNVGDVFFDQKQLYKFLSRRYFVSVALSSMREKSFNISVLGKAMFWAGGYYVLASRFFSR